MKKFLISVILLLSFCSLPACGQNQDQTADGADRTPKVPSEIMEAVIDSQSDLPELIRVTVADAEFDTYLSNYYQLDREQVTDGALCYVDGVDANEIAVLAMAEGADEKAVAESLSAYIQNRAGNFVGYAPQQEALAKNGIVVTNGGYAALLICPDIPAAKAAFLNCFGETTTVPAKVLPSTPDPAAAEGPPAVENDSASETIEPNVSKDHNPSESGEPDQQEVSPGIPQSSASEPVPAPQIETPIAVVPEESEKPSEPDQADPNYNSAAVLWAWNSGDTSALGEVNLSIYNAAKDVIDQNITSSMSNYEKELAIHDWITGWSSFSMSAFSHAPGGEKEYSVNTPYGVLINKSGTCWGYSTTFQLFMDLLGIECITVYGEPNSSGVEHTWNQVKLDGEWYCVDTAWDDPIGGFPEHRYFNLTSEEFRKTGIHYWDESAVPEAAGTKYSYGA